MKLLPDANLPHQLRTEIVGHEIFTVAYMGWSGIENGELLAKAAQAGFDALVTNDRGLEFEQNTTQLPVSVVVLLAKANTIEATRPLFPALQDALRTLKPRTLVKLS